MTDQMYEHRPRDLSGHFVKPHRPTVDHVSEAGWLQKLIDQSKFEHVVKLAVQITPALATALLERNTKNRKLSRDKALGIAGAIERGEWAPTHQGIAINTRGELHDGQHRCEAVILTGTAIVCDIHFGIDPTTFDRIDVGHSRTVGNTLEIAGVKYPELVGATARVLYAINLGKRDTGGGHLTKALSRHAIIEEVTARPDLGASVEIAVRIKASMKRVPSMQGLAAGAFLIRKRMGKHEPQEFFEGVRTGLDLNGEDDPIWRLRQRLMVPTREPAVEIAAVTIKAFNNMHRNKPTRQLRWYEGEPFPEVGT